MKEAVLAVAILGLLVYGYYEMKKLDVFLDENQKAIREEKEKKNDDSDEAE